MLGENVVITDKGRMVLDGKRYVLEAGAVIVEPHDPPVGGVDIPASEFYPAKTVRGLTDPRLVCLGRRAWSIAAFGVSKGNDEVEMDIPTEAEARVELFSGKDIFGYEWPSPVIPLNALHAYQSERDSQT